MLDPICRPITSFPSLRVSSSNSLIFLSEILGPNAGPSYPFFWAYENEVIVIIIHTKVYKHNVIHLS